VQTPSSEGPKTAQSGPCFYYLKTKIVSNNSIVLDVYEKFWKLACHVVNSNNDTNSLPTIPISLGIAGVVEKIYDGELILTVFSIRMSQLKGQCQEVNNFLKVLKIQSVLSV
jgi:hypothetical protein